MTIPLLFAGAGIVAVADDLYGFTVPDAQDTSYPFPWQSRWTKTDVDILHYGLGRRDAFLGGGRVTAQSTPNFSVAVALGTGQLRSASYSTPLTNLIPAPADGTYPRIDLVLSNGSGNLYSLSGTPSHHPLPPALPGAGTANCHAFVTIPAGAVAIYPGYIVDKRVLLASTYPALHNYAPLTSHASDTTITAGTTYYGGFVGRFAPTTTETDFQIVVPRAGTISMLEVVTGTVNTLANLVVTLRKNGSDTALVVTVTDGASAGTYSDTSHTVSVVAGDRIGLKIAETGGFANSAAIRGLSCLLDMA